MAERKQIDKDFAKEGTQMEKCHWCGGRCRVTCDCTGGVGREAAADDCPACGGSGYHTCPACGGTGRESD